MAPNTDDSQRLAAVTAAAGAREPSWAVAEDAPKEQHRPPVYNPEDYAASLRKWGRRGSLGAPQLYSLQPMADPNAGPPPPPEARSKTLPPPKDRHGGGGGGGGSIGSGAGAALSPAVSTPEMSLRQFATVSELLAKLRLDLRLAFPSFVQEFVREPLDGVTLLLELLRAVQLSQAAQSPAPVAPGPAGPAALLTGSVSSNSSPARPPPPPVMRRALLDEHACLQCLRACMRCGDAARRLAASHTGLFTLAVCIMSNVAKSRVIALELLTRACEAPGGGHGPVSEALSTLRLRFGEPVRFRFLVGMLTSAGVGAELQAAGLRFLNTFVESAPHPQLRLYLQAELEQAGFQACAVRKVLPGTAAAAEQVRQELLRWERNYIDVGALRTRAEAAERDVVALRDKAALLERRVQILQEEKGILVSLERCLQERCSDLQREVAKQRAAAVAAAAVVGSGGGNGTAVPGATTVAAGGGGGGSAGGGGSTPAEDEGISSSDQEHSLSASDSGGDVEREPMVYEMFDVHNDTILVESTVTKGGRVGGQVSAPPPVKKAPAAATPAPPTDDDDDEETTIDEVIEELRNIINDAETEAYAQEAAERAAQEKQKQQQQQQQQQLQMHQQKLLLHRPAAAGAPARAVSNRDGRQPANGPRYHKYGQATSVVVEAAKAGAGAGAGGVPAQEHAIVPARLLPQPPRRARSLVQLMYNGRRGYAADDGGAGSPFFDDDTPSHTSEDSDSLLSAARARGALVGEGGEGGGGGEGTYSSAPTLRRTADAKALRAAAAKAARRAEERTLRRSESFHHTYVNGERPVQSTAASRVRRGDSKASDASGSGRRGLPRCGSFDGLFFVTEYNSSSPDATPKPQPRTSLQPPPPQHQQSAHKHQIKVQGQQQSTAARRAAQQDSISSGRKLKSKSLDRIDEGLDSLVDIVLTDRGGVGGVGSGVGTSGRGTRGAAGSSGRGSADDWSLEWGDAGRPGGGGGGSSGAASSASPPPALPPASSSRASSQRPAVSTIFAHAARRPPDGARYGCGTTTPSARSTPAAAASGFESPPGFVLRRGGHANAGLYSGAGSRCSTSSASSGRTPRHPPPQSHRTAAPPSHASTNSRAPQSARSAASSGAGKLADLPSGLY